MKKILIWGGSDIYPLKDAIEAASLKKLIKKSKVLLFRDEKNINIKNVYDIKNKLPIFYNKIINCDIFIFQHKTPGISQMIYDRVINHDNQIAICVPTFNFSPCPITIENNFILNSLSSRFPGNAKRIYENLFNKVDEYSKTLIQKRYSNDMDFILKNERRYTFLYEKNVTCFNFIKTYFNHILLSYDRNLPTVWYYNYLLNELSRFAGLEGLKDENWNLGQYFETKIQYFDAYQLCFFDREKGGFLKLNPYYEINKDILKNPIAKEEFLASEESLK